ncbi:MAG: hypothetical protein AAFQ27_03030 [Pseudomonadota bacterium]
MSKNHLGIAICVGMMATITFGSPLVSMGFRMLDPKYESRDFSTEYWTRFMEFKSHHGPDFVHFVAKCPGREDREFYMNDDGGVNVVIEDARAIYHPQQCKVYLKKCMDPKMKYYRASPLCAG